MTWFRKRSLPLTGWVAIAVAAGALAVLSAMLLILRPGMSARTAVAVGVALFSGAVAAAIGARFAQDIGESIRNFARAAIDGVPTESASGPATDTDWMAELTELRQAVNALQLRARVAEEMAAGARVSAETASAGMFDLLSGLVAAEEATRGQLSAELHDTVAQTLISARQLVDAPEGQPGAWERLREFVEDAEEQLRATMARARPPEMRDGDLAAAVASLRAEFKARYLLDVRLSWPTEPHPLPLVSAVTVYRFFQEGLLNVIKHADVDEAEAALAVEGGTLTATVHDEGPGFDLGEVRPAGGRHVGLDLLRERARLASGRMEVDSRPGSGTTLTLSLPVGPQIGPGVGASSDVYTQSRDEHVDAERFQ